MAFASAGLLLASAGFLITQSRVADHAKTQLQALNETTAKWIATFDRLGQLDERQACSQDFVTQIRQLAFLPDGVHELMYMQGDSILCSVTLGNAAEPIALGAPDMTLGERHMDVWKNRELRMFGLPGLYGTFLKSGNFAVIISEPELGEATAGWMVQQMSYSSDGSSAAFFLSGPGAAETAGWWDFRRSACDDSRIFCVDLSASIGQVIAHERSWIVAGLLTALLVGLTGALGLNAWLNRLWAFPTRFRHLMDTENITCVYQPILSFSENRVGGIEVLARWRDITGEIVYPDRFLPVVQTSGCTRCFTEVLVQRAYRDLLALPNGGAPLRVHFNIFPQDFDAEWLKTVFAPLLLMSDKFTVVAEIVESDSMPLEDTRRSVEELNRFGILTYIDDFGAGFSNIHYLGHLALAGVKLDRAFGQAPDGSLMAGLLSSAAEMIVHAGFPLVVEGVETLERLQSLQKSGLVDQAQGYHISRPLGFSDLVSFLRDYRVRTPRAGKRSLPVAMRESLKAS